MTLVDAKLKTEIAYLKLKLNRAQKHLKKLEETSLKRREAYTRIRDDIVHFCQQWLECLDLLEKDWKSRAKAKELWFEFCQEVFPKSREELKAKIKTSQLFINGHLPEIKHPPEKI